MALRKGYSHAGYGYDDPIFNLPRLSHNKFCQLVDQNVHTIKHIPAGFPLTENQEKVRWAVRNNRPWINTDRLREALDRLLFPLCFLDFETVATAIPLYPHVAPFERIPFQYSLHVCAGDGQLMAHHEYLAEPSRDCRRELTEKLLTDCGEEGSIVSYGSFEGSVISDLSRLFPDIARALGGLVVRLVDLCGIIRNNYYHPDFHGSYSLKDVLPVLVPEMGYDDLTVSNGGDATAVFAQMTTGRMEEQEMRQARQDLLRYCGRDTEGMVRLWEALRGVLEHRDNNG